MPRIPTVVIKTDSEDGWKIINASDFDEEKHELFEGEVLPDDEAKDPAAGSGAANDTSAPDVEIPEDWTSLHWMKQASLASEIAGTKVETKDDAIEIIEAEVEKRKAAD